MSMNSETKKAELLFNLAVSMLTEPRVSAWATSAHNKPILMTNVVGEAQRDGWGALRLSTYLVCLYLG
jgi:hypothetical protein